MLNGATGVIRAAAIRHAQALSRWVSQVEAQQTADSAFREASLPPSPPAVIASLKFAYRTEDAAARNRVEAALSRWVEAVDVAGLGAHAHLRLLARHWPRQHRRLQERIRLHGIPRFMVIEDQQHGEVVYWSNEDGWVDRASATLFTPAEAATLRLPMGNNPLLKDVRR